MKDFIRATNFEKLEFFSYLGAKAVERVYNFDDFVLVPEPTAADKKPQLKTNTKTDKIPNVTTDPKVIARY